jgi:hypothetical protein
MSKTLDGSFLVKWVVAVTISLALAVLTAFLFVWSVGEAVENTFGETVAVFIVGGLFGATIAGGLGLGQALALRGQGPPPIRWVSHTLISGTISMAVGMALNFTFLDMDSLPAYLTGTIIGLTLGIPVGLAQRRLLEPYVDRATLWFPICLVAIVAGFTIGLPLGGEGREWLSVGTVSLVTALVSGAGLTWLSRGRESTLAT